MSHESWQGINLSELEGIMIQRGAGRIGGPVKKALTDKL